MKKHLARLATGVAERISHKAGRWARKRQGEDPQTAVLESRRIYILPTSVGTTFAIAVFVMLLGSMNYNNSMAFVLTFSLTAIGLVAMHHAHRNLAGTQVRFSGAEPVFAGETAAFQFALDNPSKSSRYDLFTYLRKVRSGSVDIEPGGAETVVLRLESVQRGWLTLDRFGVSTRHPFGLFRAWAWLHSSPRCLIWPSPADNAPPLPHSASQHGQDSLRGDGDEDFAGLRDYQHGDPPRHVAWKSYAKSGELKSKRFAGAALAPVWLNFDELNGRELESALSILTRWVIDSDSAALTYGLRLGNVVIEPGTGRVHRNRCLERIALFGIQDHQRV